MRTILKDDFYSNLTFFSVRIVFNEIENYDAFETCFDEKQHYFDCHHKILCVLLTNTCIYSVFQLLVKRGIRNGRIRVE